MENTLPVFYYPTTWIYIDDDETLLKTVGLTLSDHSNVKLFRSPEECLDFLSGYQSQLSANSFLKYIKNDENYGLLQNTPMDFDVTQFVNLSENKNRHNEITVAIIDYNMPTMNGFTLAKKIQDLPIKKILLTGIKQDSRAIDGFNNNFIQRFIQKGSENMSSKLYLYLKDLSTQYFRNFSLKFLAYLEAERKIALSDPAFIEFFETYLEDNNISEYYLIDKEGSFLCIDSHGQKNCLIVRTPHSINTWLNIYETQSTLSKTDLDLLKMHKKIPFFGVGKEAWQIEASQWSEHLYPPQILEGRERYFICTVSVH